MRLNEGLLGRKHWGKGIYALKICQTSSYMTALHVSCLVRLATAHETTGPVAFVSTLATIEKQSLRLLATTYGTTEVAMRYGSGITLSESASHQICPGCEGGSIVVYKAETGIGEVGSADGTPRDREARRTLPLPSCSFTRLRLNTTWSEWYTSLSRSPPSNQASSANGLYSVSRTARHHQHLHASECPKHASNGQQRGRGTVAASGALQRAWLGPGRSARPE
jgi:hypothetical protein